MQVVFNDGFLSDYEKSIEGNYRQKLLPQAGFLVLRLWFSDNFHTVCYTVFDSTSGYLRTKSRNCYKQNNVFKKNNRFVYKNALKRFPIAD